MFSVRAVLVPGNYNYHRNQDRLWSGKKTWISYLPIISCKCLGRRSLKNANSLSAGGPFLSFTTLIWFFFLILDRSLLSLSLYFYLLCIMDLVWVNRNFMSSAQRIWSIATSFKFAISNNKPPEKSNFEFSVRTYSESQ